MWVPKVPRYMTLCYQSVTCKQIGDVKSGAMSSIDVIASLPESLVFVSKCKEVGTTLELCLLIRIIPYYLVWVLFDTAIPTSIFQFISIVFYTCIIMMQVFIVHTFLRSDSYAIINFVAFSTM